MTATDPAALFTAIDETLALVTTMHRLPAGVRVPTILEYELARLLADCRDELVRHTGIVVTYPAPVGWQDREGDAIQDDDDVALAAAARTAGGD